MAQGDTCPENLFALTFSHLISARCEVAYSFSVQACTYVYMQYVYYLANRQPS